MRQSSRYHTWERYVILLRKPAGERPLGRIKCRWEGNIKMYLKDEV
jgi:hypothetical protein